MLIFGWTHNVFFNEKYKKANVSTGLLVKMLDCNYEQTTKIFNDMLDKSEYEDMIRNGLTPSKIHKIFCGIKQDYYMNVFL